MAVDRCALRRNKAPLQERARIILILADRSTKRHVDYAEMDASESLNCVLRALSVTGPPSWDAPGDDGVEALAFLAAGTAEDAPTWALISVFEDQTGGSFTPITDPLPDDTEYVPLDTSLALELVKARLQDWLLERGWQVQVSVRKGTRTWRLVDCLSFSDGGGDRLDRDYPFGDDALTVLVDSVIVVTAH